MKFLKLAGLTASAAVLVAACGSAAGPTAVTPTVAPATSATATGTPLPAPTLTAAPTESPTEAPTQAPTAAPTVAASAAAIDLCGLLTATDVQAVLGGGWLEGQLTSTGGYCHWDSGSSPNDRVIAAVDPRTFDEVKSAAAGGVEMTVAGLSAYSVRDEAFRLQTTYVDVAGQVLLLEFPISSSAEDDLASVQELIETAIGNLTL